MQDRDDMSEMAIQDDESHQVCFRYQDNRLYFSKKSERKLFFVLTMIMLLTGILVKTGLF